jgi:hypothetical protein
MAFPARRVANRVCGRQLSLPQDDAGDSCLNVIGGGLARTRLRTVRLLGASAKPSGSMLARTLIWTGFAAEEVFPATNIVLSIEGMSTRE